jgi:hypothetical protein
MPLSINDSGTWRDIQAVSVNDAGTWRDIQEIYVNDAGTWRSVFTAESITISDATAFSELTTPSTSIAQYQLTSAGAINATVGTNSLVDSGDWIAPKTNMANYECRFDLTSGSLTSGTTGAWMSLATTRTWTRQAPTSGILTAVGTLQIRRASDAVVLDTATITIYATRFAP